MRRNLAARTMSGLFVLLSGLGFIDLAHAQSCAVGETPVALGFTGGGQTVTVPAGVHSATVYLAGAQGGAGRSGAGTIGGSPNSPGGAGGLGGRVRGTLAVTPGAALSIWVGGQGSQAVNPGGIGQGVDGIGGGATDLRVGGTGIGNRVAIAGGGGGGGNAGWSTANVIAGGDGGVGGGGAGGVGAAVPSGTGPFGGGGGMVGTGGAGGAGCSSFPATAGNAANGDGGDAFNFGGSFSGAGYGGGGGGGATVGAGGGGAGVGTAVCTENWNGGGGGGAGGSSGATGLTAVTSNNGVQSGNGAALICFAASEFSVGGTASSQTGPVTVQLTATNPVSTQQVVVAQAATTFVFPTLLPQGANWNLSVLSAPAGQVCSINPASGAAIAANVTNVVLSCATVAVTVNPPTLPNGALSAAYSQTLTATSANGGVAPYTFAVTAGALPVGLTLSSAGVLSGTPTAAGSFNFTVQATSSNSFSGTRAYTLVIAQGTQTITAFTATPAAPVFTPSGTFAVSATGGASGNPVVFASTTPSVCTVAGSTVTMLSAGTCALTADQAGNANYSVAPQVALNVAIGAASQAITNFIASPAAPVFAPNSTFSVSATGGASGNPVVFASTAPSVCTVAGSTVTMLSAGTCALTADQAADADYSAAPQVALNVAIGAASQAITNFIANPAAPVFAPNGSFSVSATGGASTSPVVFASIAPSVCSVAGSTVTMLSAGTCALTADQAADANYSAAPQVTLNVAIGVASQAITNFIANPAAPVFAPNGTFSVSATGGASTSPVTFASTAPSICSVAGGTVTMLSAGICALTADQGADANYSAAPQVALNVAIGAASQAISNFIANPAAPVFAPNGTFSVSATGGASTSPVVFASLAPSVCSIAGSTVTMLSAGTCALTADQGGDANYSAAPQVALNVAIGVAAQAINGFAANPGAPVFAPNGTFTVSAMGGASTSPVTFASTAPSICSVAGSTVTMLSAGTCALTADQAGDANYGTAPQVALNVVISAASQAISNFIANPTAPVFAPNGTFSVSATGGASTSPVVFASTAPSICSVAGSTVTMLGAGTCALTADQAADANYSAAPQVALNVAIGAASQAITNFAVNPTAPVFAPNGTFSVSATGGASTSPVVFASTTPAVCTVAGSTVTMVSAGACALTADQAGDGNYSAAPQLALNVAIGAASQAITNFIANRAAPVFASNGTFSVSATGGASTSPVIFASTTPSVCTIVGSTVTMLGAGTCALTADQAGDGNYSAAAQVALNVAIGVASQAITNFAADPAAPVFSPNGTFTVSATGGASTSPIVFASTAPSVCTVAGSTVTMLSAGTCALTANQAADGNYSAAPQIALDVVIGAAIPTLSWIADLQKVYGEAAFDLPDPASDSAGDFTFSSSDPAVATVNGRTVTLVGAGVTTLTATQAAAGSYTTGMVSLALAVTDRPDPTRDPTVVGLVQAQVDASVRFAAAQQSNIGDRLRQLRMADGANPSHSGLTLNMASGVGQGLSLPASLNDASTAARQPSAWGVWTAGSITLGERERGAVDPGFDFRSDGVTLGADRRFGQNVLLGMAAGMGWNDTDLNYSDSGLDATQHSLAMYGLWRSGEHLYLDGLLGLGRLKFDIDRWSEVADASAQAQRDGDQTFASLSLGYQHRGQGLDLTGYGRLDVSRTTLDAYRESGLGIYDLSYGEQTIDSSSLALGVEGSYLFEQAGSTWRPFWTAEYRNALEDSTEVGINYVVQPVATDYVLGLRSYNRNVLAFGVGLDVSLDSGWSLSFLLRREQADAVDANSIGLRLSYGAPVPMRTDSQRARRGEQVETGGNVPR